MMSIRRFLTATALAALASWLAGAPAQAANYTFQSIVNPADPTFNQLLGINDSGAISGYFGSGAQGFPNKGYTTHVGSTTSFQNLNFPGSAQTQVTGLNNTGTFVGFYSQTNNGPPNDANFGFSEHGGAFVNVVDPNTPPSATPVNQLLGVNDSNVAVGFYVNAAGNAQGYTYNITTGTFTPVNDLTGGAVSLTAAGINNAGNIVGFFTDAGGLTHGFLDVGGTFTTLDAPGATATSLLGINNNGLIVGVETVGANTLHGVIYNEQTQSWTVLDDPNGIGTTTFNGLNDLGKIVGFYVDGNGNTIGILASAPAPEAGKGVLGLALLVLALATGRRLARGDGADATHA
jgi:probable HAF family extracellular repeat protein